MKTKNLLFTAITIIANALITQAQNVNIPDANFKAALVNNASINTNMDAEIQITEANIYSGSITVSNLSILDLTGIEAFVALNSLDCSGNQIVGLDVSANIALTYLDCSGNMESWQDPNIVNPPGINTDDVYIYYMDSLDVSANTSLTTLKCNNNGLLSLNVSGASALSYLDCRSNQRFGIFLCESWYGWYCVTPISTPIFDFLSNAALTTLKCSSNGLTSLDVSGNTLLTYLDCSKNQLTSLNVSSNVALDSLDCSSNYVYSPPSEGEPIIIITFENLNVSANTALTYLKCNNSGLTSLDVSGCTALTSLYCGSNEIPSLNVSANTALTYLDCSDNVNVEQNGMEGYNIYLYYMDSLDVSANTALTTLICNNNGLLSLNTTGLSALTYLDCSNNGRIQYSSMPGETPGYYVISTLLFDFTSNVALTYLNCSSNGLSSIFVEIPPIFDFTSNAVLTYLNCSSNGLSSLNVSSNVALTYLNCSSNGLSSLDVSSNVALDSLDCSFNVPDSEGEPIISFENLNVSANIALTYLDCSGNQLTSLNVSANLALTTLNCSYNALTSLNVSACTALTYLNCGINSLINLNVSGCTALTTLDCGANQLTSLNVSGCTALTTLDCHVNQLTSLDVKNGNNINMVNNIITTSFSAYYNPNLSCIEVDDVAWSTANWSNNIDPTAYFSENCSGVGISDLNESAAILVYPNPTTGAIFLSEKGDIALCDLSGKLLLEQQNTNQMDISALPAGIYFLHFGENNLHTFKVIKE